MEVVQTWLAKKAAISFSEKLHTRISIDRLSISFFNKVHLSNLLIEDQNKDTLLFAGNAFIEMNDWFFFKKIILFKNIELENIYVNTYRKSPKWNYQFLIDYFDTGKRNTKKSDLQIDAQNIEFKNIRLKQMDYWVGTDMVSSFEKLNMQIEGIHYDNKKVNIKNITILKPYFWYNDYTGLRDLPSTTPIVNITKTDSSITSKNESWSVYTKELHIIDGVYQNDLQTSRTRYNDQFDGQHLYFGSIHADITNASLTGDTLTAHILLSTKEISGLHVKKLESNLVVTSKKMEFNDLDVYTNKSHLGNYYSMNYDSFVDDMSEFTDSIQLKGTFIGSTIHSDDIAIFAPELKNWHKTFTISGNGSGMIEDLHIDNLNVKTNTSAINGTLDLKNTTNVDKLFIDWQTKGSQTSIDELADLFPTLNQPQLIQLGKISFKGRHNGTLSDFNTEGSFTTDLGNVDTKIRLSIPSKQIPSYEGYISCNHFKLGKILDNNGMKDISFSGSIKGHGFDLTNLNANFSGKIEQLEYNKYNYQDISINGNFSHNQFNGHLDVNDPNLKINNADGIISLHDKEITLQLNAEIEYANLKKLQILPQNISTSGLFKLNFTGSNIDNFVGEAKIYNASLQRDNKKMSFDSLVFNSSSFEGKKQLTLNTNELNAKLEGSFKILELPDAFSYFLNNYYPKYISKPTYELSKQNFSFEIRSRNIEEYLQLFNSKISGGNDAIIKGHINLEKNDLGLQADIPAFGYNHLKLKSIDLSSIGNSDSLLTKVVVDNINLNDSFDFPQTSIFLSTKNDNTGIKIKTSATNAFNDAQLDANLTTLSNGFKLHFNTSSFIVNEKKWIIENNGEISIKDHFINVHKMNFVQGDQSLSISTELDDVSNNQQLVAAIKNIELEDFSPILLKKNPIKGKLTGKVNIVNPLDNPQIDFNGNVEKLEVENEKIGNTTIKISANTESGNVDFTTNTLDSNQFTINGKYNYKDSSDRQIDAALQAKTIHLSILKPYLGVIFDDINGEASSNLKVYGNKNHPFITGDVQIKNAAFTIGYTKCKYTLNEQLLHFYEDEINLDYLEIKDIANNSGALKGSIHHHFFDEFSLNHVKLETSKLTLLNTQKKDNPQFYGNVVGKATMDVNGPINNIQMNIEGEPSLLDSSHIYLSTSNARESNAIDYIQFTQLGSAQQNNLSTGTNNFLINLSIKANPSCKVDVILDEQTGDVIKGQGNGMINISVGTINPLTIRGNYNITKGEYNFNFQTFFQKPFSLKSGQISWNGDPLLANMDINTEYFAKNVDISSLSPNITHRQKEDIRILAHLTGVLQKPLVKFDLELTEKSDAKRDDIVVKKLSDFKNDDNEMNKQVASLLLFNTFIVGNQNFLSQGNATNLLTNTVGGIMSGLLTNFFNKELEKATKGIVSTYVDINPTIDVQKNASELQANIRAGLKLSLNKRLEVLLGGNLDYNDPTYTQQFDKKGLLSPDITIEWMINKDGTLRVVGFNKSSIDLSLTKRNRSGIQLTFRKDLDKFSDIFKANKN